MWWPSAGNSDKPAGSSKPQDDTSSPSQNATTEPKKAAADFDPNKLPDRQKLPPKLQKIMDKADKEENFFDELVEG